MRRWSQLASLVAVCVVGGCKLVARDEVGGAKLNEFRALVYAEEFAERFQLQKEAAIKLDSGVLAIAIHVHQTAARNPACLLQLYLDDSVPFAYPPGTGHRVDDLRPESGPLFFAEKLSPSDGTAANEKLGGMRMLYRSRDYSEQHKQGIYDGGPVAAFYRTLLPNLNVVEYSVACKALGPKYWPADIWLLRQGHDTGELLAVADNADTRVATKIAIPPQLLKASADATARATQQPLNLEDPPMPRYTVPGAAPAR